MERVHDIGIVAGRFQIFHKGHLEFVLEGKKRCRKLIIGITNYDISHESLKDQAGDHRMTKASNPLTFYERYEMIKRTLMSCNMDLKDFDIIPFPINQPEKIAYFLSDHMTFKFLVTIYDEWGDKKIKRIEDQGYKTEVMWSRSDADRITSGSEIRHLIRTDKPWHHLVPQAVYDYMTTYGLDKKVKETAL